VPVGAQRGYLQPFKPKADADYLAKTRQRVQKRSRKHEALVNAFTEWLTAHGYQSLRNRAIDIGLERPPVIIEAEVITSWSRAIREAVGQLYEYRFFQVVAPDSRLAFLASAPIPPEWVSYLEEDRGIATVWRDGEDFYFSKKAREAFELP
jgi:hypothetical protein